MGEASKNLSDEIVNKYSFVKWSDISRTKDKVIHHYFGVNLEIVWDIIINELLGLSNNIKSIIDDLNSHTK